MRGKRGVGQEDLLVVLLPMTGKSCHHKRGMDPQKERGQEPNPACTEAKILSQRTVLKAFLKSSFTSACWSFRFWRKSLAEWTVASAPPLMPNLNWQDANRAALSSSTLLETTLAASHQRVQPTAIGLTLPSFFCRAIRLAPRK